MRDLLTVSLRAKEVCALSSPLSRNVPVTVRSGSAPFGTIRKATSFTAHITDGEPYAGIVVEAETESVFVRAIAETADVDLHPTRVSVFGGIVMPMADADLTLVRAKPEGLELALEVPASIELEGRPGSVEAALPCSIVSLVPEPFDPFETYFGVPTGYARLRGGRIPIAASAGGKALATLAPGPDTARDVFVLAREKLQTKIAWGVGDVMAFGWVDTGRLDFDTEKPARGAKIGLGNISTRGGCCEHVFVCKTEVPFRAERDDVTETVGVLAPGVKIRVYRTSNGVHHAEVREKSFESNGDVLVSPEHVRGCDDLVEQGRRKPRG